MSASKYIEDLKAKQPKLFAAKRISITVVSFLSIVEHAHKAGAAEQDKFHKELNDMACDGSIFEQMFGGGFGRK